MEIRSPNAEILMLVYVDGTGVMYSGISLYGDDDVYKRGDDP